MTRARLSVLPLSLVLAASVAAPALADPPPVRDAGQAQAHALPPQGEHPEGIGVFGDQYYVGATSDGTLYRGTVGQDAAVFSPGGADGRTTAIGVKATADRLYVAGGGTGFVFVYDRRSGALLATYTNDASRGATFLNDVAIAPDGSAYVTDSRRPVLYRIPATLSGTAAAPAPLPVAVRFTGTAFAYQPAPAFNANGIAITRDGKTAYVVQSGTGALFAVRLKDAGRQGVKQVAVTDGDGGPYALTAGDGLLLQGSTLSVLRNAQELLVTVALDRSGTRGVVTAQTTDETFQFPTTLAAAGDRFLVVNSQFDRRRAGTAPERPFTVSSIPAP